MRVEAEIFDKAFVSDFEVDPESVKREIVDAMSHVEKWDLIVERIQAGVSADGFLTIEAFPEAKFMPGKSDNNGYKQEPVHTSKRVTLCPECLTRYMADRVHPDNGCKLGTVDQVLRT